MSYSAAYTDTEPSRDEIDASRGALLIEFGSPYCGYCRAAQAPLADALADHPSVRHLKIEDGRGRRLGRSFAVKLWPTLVFLRDGQECERLVRPHAVAPIRAALDRLIAP